MANTTTASSTAQVLEEMLRENTGTHFLDSGGYPRHDEQGRYAGSDCGYGRNWERNQRRAFSDEPETVLSFKYGGIDVTHSVYHWLLERVEFDADMQALFDEFVDGRDDTYWRFNGAAVFQPRKVSVSISPPVP